MGGYGVFLNRMLPEIEYDGKFSLQRHTTVGIGGRADLFTPHTVGQLCAFISLCNRCHAPWVVLGRGSNVLPPDGDYPVPVLSLGAFSHIGSDGREVVAESGVSTGKLLAYCLKKGLGGVEFLSGIPATVGGLTAMNGGTAQGHMADVVTSVTCIQNGKVVTLTPKQCKFGQKRSVFLQAGECVLSVKMTLTPTPQEKIREKIKNIMESRKTLPVGKSMGCVFKNPYPSLSAGSLIDFCGLKGERVGGAVVSIKHANFILNEGNATSSDVKKLIATVKRRVYLRTGILLQEEIRYL